MVDNDKKKKMSYIKPKATHPAAVKPICSIWSFLPLTKTRLGGDQYNLG